jgi:GTP-binding protein LepA
MKIKMMSTNQEYIVEKVGVFTPKATDINELNAGEIGFITTGIKVLSETKVGDTICDANKPLKKLYQDLNQVNQLYFVDYFQLIVLNIKN